MTSFCPKNRQNDVIWPQKSISVKMLQMGWNFDTSSKIRQKTQKSNQKITMTSLWRHFGRFLQKNEKIWFFHFYGGLSEKKDQKMTSPWEKNSIFELQIFFYNFWPSFSPIGPFFGNLCHFSIFTCFVLEVPENQWFLQFFFENAAKIWNLAPTTTDIIFWPFS